MQLPCASSCRIASHDGGTNRLQRTSVAQTFRSRLKRRFGAEGRSTWSLPSQSSEPVAAAFPMVATVSGGHGSAAALSGAAQRGGAAGGGTKAEA